MNGFHDAANAIATVVSTGVLRPQYGGGDGRVLQLRRHLRRSALHVAATVGKGTIDPQVVDHTSMFGALVGAIVWNIDHLVLRHSVVVVACADRRPGGRGGGQGRHRRAGRRRPAQDRRRSSCCRRCWASCSAPLMMLVVSWLFVQHRRRARSTRWFRRLQLVSAAAYSLGHGGNDAQKTMGIIWMLLIAAGVVGAEDPLPLLGRRSPATPRSGWARCSAAGASSRRWARRSPSCKPVGGFCAETGGAITLFLATRARRAGVDDAHDHRRHRRRGFGAEDVGGALGRGRQHRVGLGVHDSCVGFLGALAWWIGTLFF